MQNSYVEEIFYFEPRQYGVNSDYVHEVCIIGEFNDWGHNQEKLKNYKLIKDKVGRWVGLFSVPAGKGFYKFLINNTTICPTMGLLSYSSVATPEWAQKCIWYQIMVDRFNRGNTSSHVSNLLSWDASPDYFNNFGGDLQGVVKKIDYFKDLFGSLENVGFYLNPINKSLASNHKYWPESFMDIDPQFGTDKDLQELIDCIHREQGKIILDLVYNHTGLNHPAFIDILANGKNSKFYHWYRKLVWHEGSKVEIPILERVVDGKPQNLEIINNPGSDSYNSEVESYFSIWGGKYKFPITNPEKFKNSSIEDMLNNQDYYKLIAIGSRPSYASWADFFEIPELNTENSDVKEHLFKAARKWIKLGIDGFRLDVPDLLNGAHDFWKEFRQEVKEEAALNGKNPDDIYIVGELWTAEGVVPSYLYADEDSKPLRYDAIMNYPVRESILNFFSGEIINKGSDRVFSSGEISAEDLDKNLHKNLGYLSWGTDKAQFNPLSSHDTRRIRTALNDDRKLKAALIMQFTLVGSPTVYYGDELAMLGGIDPANRATICWKSFDNLHLCQDKFDIYNFYKKLISLRKQMKSLVESPLFTLKVHNDDKIYSYGRFYNLFDCAIVAVSKNESTNDIELDLSKTPFERIKNWHDFISKTEYYCYESKVIVKAENMKEHGGIVLLPSIQD